MKRTLALILSLVMCLGLLAGCGDKKTDDGQTDGKTLVVGTQNFDGKFSPFFYTNDYENQVMGMVFDGLFLVDREGSVVLKGIEGDVRPYNGTDYTYKGIADCDIVENSDGTVDYNITLKEGVKFSDGEEMTIDDVIFSYYVLLDPAYDGVSTLYSLPIKGLEAYRSGMDTVQNLILAAGPDAYAANDFYTEEQYNAYWAAFNAAGWTYRIDFDYISELSKQLNMSCIGATNYSQKTIYLSEASATLHEFGHFLDWTLGIPAEHGQLYLAEAQNSGLRDYAKTNAREYFADCFAYCIIHGNDSEMMESLRKNAPQTCTYFEELGKGSRSRSIRSK